MTSNAMKNELVASVVDVVDVNTWPII